MTAPHDKPQTIASNEYLAYAALTADLFSVLPGGGYAEAKVLLPESCAIIGVITERVADAAAEGGDEYRPSLCILDNHVIDHSDMAEYHVVLSVQPPGDEDYLLPYTRTGYLHVGHIVLPHITGIGNYQMPVLVRRVSDRTNQRKEQH